MAATNRVHPFIIMCAIFFFVLLLTGNTSQEVSSLREVSTKNEMEMHQLTRVDGTFSGNPYGKIEKTTVKARAGTVQETKRPVMFTFYEPIPDELRNTGMDDQSDRMLLQAWEKHWQAAGWQTKILNLSHAKLHPRFEEYERRLQDVPLNGMDGKGRNVQYNQYCYYRWLAMASVGGGFMSDYDNFPLQFGSGVANQPQRLQLPNQGRFTVYSVASGSEGAGIPCLMSGSDGEWMRLAFAILRSGEAHARDEKHWTDMFALMDLRYEQGLYIAQNEVLDGRSALFGRDWQESDCHLSQGKRAIHFSHDSVKHSDMSHLVGLAGNAQDRVLVMEAWMRRWKQVCQHP